MPTTILCFLMAICAWGGYFYGNGFYLSALAATHGWTVGDISTAISLGFWTCIPAALVVGWVLDRHGRRHGALLVVTYGAAAMAFGLYFLGRVDALWQLYPVYMLMGSAYPALAAPAISAILDQRVQRNYSTALAIALTGASVGGVVAVPALVAASSRYGFESTLAALAALIVAVLVPVAAWVLRPTGAAAKSVDPPGGAMASVLRSRAFRWIGLAALGSLAAQVGFLAHQLSVLETRLLPAQAALVISATAVASALGRFAITALDGRLALSRLAAGCYVAQALGIGAVAASNGAAVGIVGSLLMGLFVGAIVMLPPLLCRAYFDSAMYARAYGVVAMSVYLGGGIGPTLTGVLRDTFSDGSALACLAAVSGLAAVAVTRLSAPTASR